MTRLIGRSVLILCTLAVATQASAEVVLLSQSRSVHASAEQRGISGTDESSKSHLAPDFGLFEDEVRAFVTEDGGSSGAGYVAIQDSEIQVSGFKIRGTAFAHAEARLDYGLSFSSSGSDFEVTFEVTAPLWVGLSGLLTSASLQLDWNGAPLLTFDSVNDGEMRVGEILVLERGTYTLTVIANASAYSAAGDGYVSNTSISAIDVEMGTEVAVEEMGVGRVKAMYR